MWNLLSTILQPIRLNLSDMDHFRPNSLLFQLVANSLDEPVNHVRPVFPDIAQFRVTETGDGGSDERYLIFAVSLLQPPSCLSQGTRTRASQTLALWTAFSRFGGIWNSDKPKGATAPPGIVLRFQRSRKPELLFEVQEVPVLAIRALLTARECLFLESPLKVEGSLAIWINF